MRITGVTPAEGPVAGRTLVTITGANLPELPDVFFGDERAQVVSVVAPTFIVVDTPPGEPGWVNVRVVDRASGDEAVLDNAYLYVEEGVEPPPSTTTTTAWVPPTTTPIVTTTTLPVTTTPTTAPVVTTLPPATTTMPPAPVGDPFQDWRDSMLRTPEGLELAPPAADDPINNIPLDVWIGNYCDQPVCPGWVLED